MSGQHLARRFYEQTVAPLLAGVAHAAALLGEGSEVLGYDDAVSTDHDFGPRVQIFVPDPDEARARLCGASVRHPVTVTTAAAFFTDRLGFDPATGPTLADWLLTPTQVLASLTRGAVFTDSDGVLARYRATLRWYPDDIWRYALAAGWQRFAQEEPFGARTASTGDDLGSRIITARLARELIRLTFLVERCWAPYPKWLGRAFTERALAGRLRPLLAVATTAVRGQERQGALVAAAGLVAAATNDLRLAAPVDPAPRRFHTRDIEVLGADRFTAALTAQITDPDVRGLLARLGEKVLPGTIDQVTDNTDVLCSPQRCRAAAPLLGLRR